MRRNSGIRDPRVEIPRLGFMRGQAWAGLPRGATGEAGAGPGPAAAAPPGVLRPSPLARPLRPAHSPAGAPPMRSSEDHGSRRGGLSGREGCGVRRDQTSSRRRTEEKQIPAGGKSSATPLATAPWSMPRKSSCQGGAPTGRRAYGVGL